MIYDKQDCCFERGGNRFRYRVGAIVIEDGEVLLATNAACGYYYSIGGGVHFGETSEQAVLRELKEETGADYEIDRLAFIHENLFSGDNSNALKGMMCHEISLYYLVKPRGSKDIKCESVSPDGKEYAEWVPIDILKQIKVFPEFYKDMLSDIPSGVTHVVTGIEKICK